MWPFKKKETPLERKKRQCDEALRIVMTYIKAIYSKKQLRDLKVELQDFNAKTGQWKSINAKALKIMQLKREEQINEKSTANT